MIYYTNYGMWQWKNVFDQSNQGKKEKKKVTYIFISYIWDVAMEKRLRSVESGKEGEEEGNIYIFI